MAIKISGSTVIDDSQNGTLTGTQSVTGNITGGNINTAGVVSAGGNVQAGNLRTAGLVSVTGGVTAASVAGGVITGTSASLSGAVTAASTVGGVITGSSVSVSGTATAASTVGGVITGSSASLSANVTGGNILTGGLISATGNVTGATHIGTTFSGNLTGTSASVTGTLTGASTVGGVITGTSASLSANVTGGNVLTGGIVSSGGNIVGATKLLVGTGSSTLTNPVAVFQGSGATYDQLAMYNSTATGSADLVAYANNGDDTNNWIDMGFTGNGFSDTNYTITAAGDGYLFVQGNAATGGNLVVATGNVGTTRDIVFSFGWLGANEFLRFKRSTNTILPYSNITANLGGTSNYFNNVYAVTYNGTAVTTTGTITGGNLATAGTATIGGLTLSGNTIISSGSTLTLDPNSSGGNDGEVTIAGNLHVTGNVTYYDSNVITINDKFINVANNAATAAAANGGGLGVGPVGAEYASLTYNSTSNTWVISNGANIAGTVSASGAATVGSLSTGGAISTAGTVTAASTVGGVITGSSASVSGGVTAASVAGGVITGTSVSASGALTGASLTVSGQVGAATASVTGNISAGNISVAGNINLTGNTNTITGNAAVFTGNAIGSGALYAGVSGGNAALQYPVFAMTSTANAYTQMGGQNTNTGTQASFDYCITADGGSDTTDYVDLGMAGSAWNGTQTNSLGTAVGARDGYLYVQGGSGGGNLVLGTSTAGRTVKFVLGGVNSANVFTTIANTGISTNSLSASGTLTAASTVGGVITGSSASVTGAVTAASTVGGVITGSSASVTGTLTGASTVGGVITGSSASTSGTITGGNLATGGTVSATGNITGGNISATNHTGTTVSVSGAITGASVVGGVMTGTSVSVSGGVTAASVAGGVITGTSVSASGAVTGASLVGTITTASQTNITAVGTLSSLNSGAISSSGTVTGTALVSTIATGTAPLTVTSTTKVTNLNVEQVDGYHADQADTINTIVVRDASGYANVSGILNGGTSATGNIGSVSVPFNTVFAKATSAQYADLAEKYVGDFAYAPGTVVSFGGTEEVTRSATDSDRRIAGVVSTNPSYIMNGGLEGNTVVTVALTGRVPVSVTGTIAKGDMMVSAGNGVARAEENPAVGTVIGKALEDFSGESGVIEVVVGRL